MTDLLQMTDVTKASQLKFILLFLMKFILFWNIGEGRHIMKCLGDVLVIENGLPFEDNDLTR